MPELAIPPTLAPPLATAGERTTPALVTPPTVVVPLAVPGTVATPADTIPPTALVPVANVHRIPDHVGFEEAAVVPTVWMTAWHALMDTADLRMGESILIHAAASGVSTAAIQLAKAAGAFVVATASTPEKLEYATRIGADVVINSTDGDVVAETRRATDGRGVDVVLDHVGPAVWDASIYSLAAKGRLVFLGNTTGNRASLDLVYAYHFGLRLLGSDPYNRHEFPAMLAAYWAGDFVTPIDQVFPLGNANQSGFEHPPATSFSRAGFHHLHEVRCFQRIEKRPDFSPDPGPGSSAVPRIVVRWWRLASRFGAVIATTGARRSRAVVAVAIAETLPATSLIHAWSFFVPSAPGSAKLVGRNLVHPG